MPDMPQKNHKKKSVRKISHQIHPRIDNLGLQNLQLDRDVVENWKTNTQFIKDNYSIPAKQAYAF
jgi:signal transduction histidine kinase